MKPVLILALAASALAGAAAAQPAWHPSEGGPPDAYPPCTHYGEDRCQQGWGDEGRAYGYGERYGERYGYGYHHYHRYHRYGGYYGHPYRRSFYGRHYGHRYYGHSSTDGERG